MLSKKVGICRLTFGGKWYLGYGPHGRLRWLPFVVQRAIVGVWNRAYCCINGHVPLTVDEDDIHVACVHCGKK